MSSGLSSRLVLRTCKARRLYSSSPTEKFQSQAPRAPMVDNFGGVKISPSPPRNEHRPRRGPNQQYVPMSRLDTRTVGVSESPEGLAYRLAKISVKRENNKEDTPLSSAAKEWSGRPSSQTDEELRDLGAHGLQSRPQSSDATPQGGRPHVRDQNQPGRSGREQPRWSEPGRPDATLTHTGRESRRGSGSGPAAKHRRGSKRPSRQGPTRAQAVDWNDDRDENMGDENDAVATPFVLRRPDPPLPPTPPTLSPPLTALETRLDINGHNRGVHEQQGGDYTRHFSPHELKLVQSQSVAALEVVGYAKLALNLNASMNVREKRLGAQLVKNVAKMEVATGP